MSLIKIRGQDYETAWSRIMRFRRAHPLWSIITEIVVDDGERVLVRASLLNEEGRIISTGTAEEQRGSSSMSQKDRIEKARRLFEKIELEPGRRLEVEDCLSRGDLSRLTAIYNAERSKAARIAAEAPRTSGNSKGDNIPQGWKDESLRPSQRG